MPLGISLTQNPGCSIRKCLVDSNWHRFYYFVGQNPPAAAPTEAYPSLGDWNCWNSAPQFPHPAPPHSF